MKEEQLEELKDHLHNTLRDTLLPEIGKPYSGKVRDNYVVSTGDKQKKRIMITSDRISCFDCVLRQCIPFKGQVLNQLALFWFEQTKDIVKNHLVESPDPNVIVAKECKPIPIEFVVRGYMTGSLWRKYKKGIRKAYGFKFPDGLSEGKKFKTPILTPTTKAEGGHDIDITKTEIIEKGILTEERFRELEKISIALFAKGQEIANQKGLVLVDTKYEFGLDENGDIVLIDEIHTPDSSRFWDAEAVKQGQFKGHLSKEYVRDYLINQGFMNNRGEDMPDLPDEVVLETAKIYIQLYEELTGKRFEMDSYPIEQRLISNLRKKGYLKGAFVPIVMGSKSDLEHAQKIGRILIEHGVTVRYWFASAHKTPELIGVITEHYNKTITPLVYVTIAGRSNGLSGAIAANAVHPVVACPPHKDKSDYMVNVHSTLQMPSETPVMTVVDPKNAALSVLRILGTSCGKLRRKQADKIQSVKKQIALLNV